HYSTAVGNGIKLDAAGPDLVVTGGVNGNLFAGKLTDLASAQPTVVYDSAFATAAGMQGGTAIAPDSTGAADLAFTFTSASGNMPGWAQVSPDGSIMLGGM